MRNFCVTLWVLLTATLGMTIVWILYGVLNQPVYGSEGVSLKNNGLVRPVVRTPYSAPQKATMVTTGRITGYGSPSSRVHLRTYDKGNYTITTGRIGNKTVRLKEYKRPE